MKSRCWAHSLGGCDSMSGEHVISNAVFSAGCGCSVIVDGVVRIRGGAPTANAEKSNILCRTHNSMLSPLDATIGKLARFQASASDPSFSDRLYLDGDLLERWLLKTIVNFGAAGWLGPEKISPAPEVVAAIFGEAPVPVGVGLYTVDGLDPGHRPSGGVSVLPLFRMFPAGRSLVGAYVAVHGLGLLACLDDSLPLEIESGLVPVVAGRFAPGMPRQLYHPGAVVMERKEGSSLIVGLAWGGVFKFADGTTATVAEVESRNNGRARPVDS